MSDGKRVMPSKPFIHESQQNNNPIMRTPCSNTILHVQYVESELEVRSHKNFCLFQVGFKIVQQTGSVQFDWTVRYSTTTQPKKHNIRRNEDFFEPKFRSSIYSRFYVIISASASAAKDSSDRGSWQRTQEERTFWPSHPSKRHLKPWLQKFEEQNVYLTVVAEWRFGL